MAPKKPGPELKKVSSHKVLPKNVPAKKAQWKAPSRGVKQIFKGLVISFSGDFGGDSWSHESMGRWFTLHGGVWEREVNEDTTHLICSIDDYKKKTPQVKKAWALGPKCHIVVKDWLEDCLPPENAKKRCRAEKGYTLNRVLKRLNRTHKAQIRYRQSFEEGVRAAKELVDNRLNHVFCDDTGFEYKVVCTRINTDGKVKSEKYTIYLFQSNAKPHHYMAGAKLSQPGRAATYWRHECHPKMFHEAFADFKKFFEKKTKIAWDDRLDGLPQDPNDFRYDVPKLGRPVGDYPEGKKKPTWESEDDEMHDSSDSGVGLVYDTDSEAEDEFDGAESPNRGPRGRRSSTETSTESGGSTSKLDYDHTFYPSSIYSSNSSTAINSTTSHDTGGTLSLSDLAHIFAYLNSASKTTFNLSSPEYPFHDHPPSKSASTKRILLRPRALLRKIFCIPAPTNFASTTEVPSPANTPSQDDPSEILARADQERMDYLREQFGHLSFETANHVTET